MAEVLIYAGSLLYATFLMWGGFTAIRVLSPLVIAPRPAAYVAMRQAAIWSVGLASISAGLSLVADAISRGA